MLVASYNVVDVTRDMILGCARGLTYDVFHGKKLSSEFSRRFNGHLTQCARESGINRDKLKLEILRRCIDEQWQADGGQPYPYTMITVKLIEPIGSITHVDVLEPLSTSGRTNSEMMTAYSCLQDFATSHGIELKEKYVI